LDVHENQKGREAGDEDRGDSFDHLRVRGTNTIKVGDYEES